MKIRIAFVNDIPKILDVAEATWKQTYSSIISQEQIDFMYEKMYTLKALNEQLQKGDHFVVFSMDGVDAGFFSYSLKDNLSLLKIPKLYILPSFQGRKIGREVIGQIKKIGKTQGVSFIELNVNRNNPAVNFYLKTGFWIKETVDIPYFDFVLNDYVMVQNI